MLLLSCYLRSCIFGIVIVPYIFGYVSLLLEMSPLFQMWWNIVPNFDFFGRTLLQSINMLPKLYIITLLQCGSHFSAANQCFHKEIHILL